MSASAAEGHGAETHCRHRRLCLPHPVSFHSLHAPCCFFLTCLPAFAPAIPQPGVPSPPLHSLPETPPVLVQEAVCQEQASLYWLLQPHCCGALACSCSSQSLIHSPHR